MPFSRPRGLFFETLNGRPAGRLRARSRIAAMAAADMAHCAARQTAQFNADNAETSNTLPVPLQ